MKISDNLTVKVLPAGQEEIGRIWVFHETEDLVIVRIETATKYPKPTLAGSRRLDFILKPNSGEPLSVPVFVEFDGFPWEHMGIPSYGTGRYYLDVVFTDYELDIQYSRSRDTVLLFDGNATHEEAADEEQD